MIFSANMKSRDLELLSKSYIFKALTSEEIKTIANQCKIKTFKKNDLVFKEGDLARGLYTLLEGQIQVFLPISSNPVKRPAQINLAKLESGVSIGEYSLIDDFPASASIKSIGNTRFSFLPQLNFEELLVSNERLGRIIYRNMLKSMVSKLRKNDKELDLMYKSG